MKTKYNKLTLFLILIFGLNVSKVLANGGPILSTNICKTGNPEFLSYTQVKIKEETLNIHVGVEFVDVQVIYLLDNQDLFEDDSVLYGFPVDIFKIYGDIESLQKFEIFLDDESLEIKEIQELTKYTDSTFNRLKNSYGKITRKWFYTTLALKKERLIQKVEVRYRTKTFGMDFVTTKDSYRRYDYREFKYDFSAASAWGNGICDKLYLNIDLTEIEFVNPTIHGLDFVIERDSITGFEVFRPINTYLYNLTYENFDFNNKNLKISYDFKEIGYCEDLIKNQVEDSNIIHFSSSAQAKWNLLSDTSFKTGCILPLYATLEFKFKPNIPVHEFHFLDGNFSDSVAYTNYSRIKKLKIEYKQTLRDGSIEKIEAIVPFDDLPFRKLNRYNFYKSLRQYSIGYFNSLDYLKVTILETYPGKKYKEVFLTEFFLNGPLFKFKH